MGSLPTAYEALGLPVSCGVSTNRHKGPYRPQVVSFSIRSLPTDGLVFAFIPLFIFITSFFFLSSLLPLFFHFCLFLSSSFLPSLFSSLSLSSFYLLTFFFFFPSFFPLLHFFFTSSSSSSIFHSTFLLCSFHFPLLSFIFRSLFSSSLLFFSFFSFSLFSSSFFCYGVSADPTANEALCGILVSSGVSTNRQYLSLVGSLPTAY